MKNILAIFKKEWDRVIKDKRLVITIMILPGLMIFLIYTFIGNAMSGAFQEDIYNIAIVNPTADFTSIYETYEDMDLLNVITIQADEIDAYKEKIDDESWTILIAFDDGLESYTGVEEKPFVYFYYNPNVISSESISSRFIGYLNAYEEALSFELWGNTTYFAVTQDGTELDEGGFAGTILSGLLPMLIIMFLFSGAMSIGPESIAGEKERGTIATLLITPVKRSQIAIGKVLALSVLTLISATSSFIGIMLSLPKLLQMEGSLPSNIYAVGDYLMILVVLFSTVFLIVGIISIVSAYAKNLKEAGTLIAPIYILTILVSVTTIFGSGANPNLYMYAVPIYNTVQALIAIFSFDPNVGSYILVTVISNLIIVVLLIYLLNKMFNSEKIMFSK